MINFLKPYQEMKDSGIEWFGKVPAHWELRKLRSLLNNIADRNRPDLPLLSVVREKGVIVRDVSSKDENHNFIPDDLTNYKVVRAGQFAMNKMKAWQGSYGVSGHDGIVSPAYFVFDLDGVSGDFFHSAIRSKAYVPFFTSASDGVRIGQWDLSKSRMNEIAFSIPPLSEQAAIVKYLDYMDQRIKKLIAAKKKLIKLLEEQKQAIIHQAVTKGLDPNVPMKDSGIEWLGEVPEHWDRVSMASIASPKSVVGGPDRELLSVYLKLGVVKFSDVDEKRTNATSEDLSKYQSVGVGDFVLNNQQAWRGSVGVSNYSGIISPAYIVCSLSDRLNTEYANLLFRDSSMVSQYVICSKGVGSIQRNLYWPYLKRTWLFLPPKNEQEAIVDYVDRKTTEINISIAKSKHEISLLDEYHTRLISDVVTGKLDVREAVATLPDEDHFTEPELLADFDNEEFDDSTNTEMIED